MGLHWVRKVWRKAFSRARSRITFGSAVELNKLIAACFCSRRVLFTERDGEAEAEAGFEAGEEAATATSASLPGLSEVLSRTESRLAQRPSDASPLGVGCMELIAFCLGVKGVLGTLGMTTSRAMTERLSCSRSLHFRFSVSQSRSESLSRRDVSTFCGLLSSSLEFLDTLLLLLAGASLGLGLFLLSMRFC